MQHYAFHIGDYVKATAHLTDAEDLAYRRLLDLYYDTEGHIPYEAEQAARRVRLGVAAVVQILKEFFVDTGSEWVHLRCDQEIEKIYEKSEKARDNGKRSGEARRAKAERTLNVRSADVERNANGIELPVTRNPLPVTQRSNTPRKKACSVSLPDDFSLTPDLLAWAKSKGHSHLPERFEHFIGYAKANGKKYADWNQAFQNAVRDDWAKLNGKPGGPVTVVSAPKRVCECCGSEGVKRIGQSWYCGDHHQFSTREAA